jgi:hypothetical protein
MPRKRFTAQEKIDFVPGTAVEWRNGSHWHPATVRGEIGKDSLDLACVWIENHATTRTVSKGQCHFSYPGSLRMPVK